MTPSKMRATTLLEKAGMVQDMLAGIRALPLADIDEFRGDFRNPAAAESYLRGAFEGLLDLGRHMLAKAFGRGPAEYKEIPADLMRVEVLDEADGALMRDLAGYRNRLVHFCDEISERELFDICSAQLGDLERILVALLGWARDHPEMVDGRL